MRRFWLFPLGFAGLFLGFELFSALVGSLLSAILLPLMRLKTDVYLHSLIFDFRQYLPFPAFGMGVGLVFAALDFALHPEDPRGDKARLHFLKFWRLFFGALAIILINNAALEFGLSYWGAHRRYHAYSPQFQILNWLSMVPLSVFLFLVGWTMVQTLRRPRRAN